MEVVQDPNHLEQKTTSDWLRQGGPNNKASGVFHLGHLDIEKLKQIVLSKKKGNNNNLRLSTFVLSVGYAWVCRGLNIGGYPDTLITIQAQVEKDVLCDESSRRWDNPYLQLWRYCCSQNGQNYKECWQTILGCRHYRILSILIVNIDFEVILVSNRVDGSSNEMSWNFSKWCSMATNTHLGFIPSNFLLNGGSTSGKVVIHRINDGDMCLFICGSSESTWNIIFMTTRDVIDHPFPATTLFVVQVYSDLVSFQRSIGLIYCDRCFSTISHVTFAACPRGTKASTHVLYFRLIYTSHEGKIFHGQVTETDSGKGDGSGTTHDRQGHDMSRQIKTPHYCSRLTKISSNAPSTIPVNWVKLGLWVNPRVPELIGKPELENLAKTYDKFCCTWLVDRGTHTWK
ncbi:hypothetical protein V8G54_000054 (mitochondrion) [Vigna mungo]|uniref:Uncharacterized protein n=1 Tax=Vigna mungo TaxID=3915 RepID=A0AAQ3SHJ6_VIGMU